MAGAAESILSRRWAGLTRYAQLGNAASIGRDLLIRYGEPHRAYHDLLHLMECLAELDVFESLCQDRAAVEMALWFHDAVYDPTRSDNEAASAKLAADQLATLGMKPGAIARVHQLVLDTAHKSDPATPDGRLIVDIDLSILGKNPDRFDNYDRAIRAEYAHVPEPAYRAGRAAVLQGFLDRPAIYRTERFAALYERQARQNLARAIGRLRPA